MALEGRALQVSGSSQATPETNWSPSGRVRKTAWVILHTIAQHRLYEAQHPSCVFAGWARDTAYSLTVTRKGTPCRALVDTGSTIFLVLARTLPGTSEQRPQGWESTTLCIATVMGKQAQMKGSVAGSAVHYKFWLANIPDSCIIGLDLLARWGAMVDVPGAWLFLGTEAMALHAVGSGGGHWPGDSPMQPYYKSPLSHD